VNQLTVGHRGTLFNKNLIKLIHPIVEWLAKVATTSSIGLGIFFQHASAATGTGGGATVVRGVPCTLGPIQHGVTSTQM
jgi:hypothetical protein